MLVAPSAPCMGLPAARLATTDLQSVPLRKLGQLGRLFGTSAARMQIRGAAPAVTTTVRARGSPQRPTYASVVSGAQTARPALQPPPSAAQQAQEEEEAAVVRAMELSRKEQEARAAQAAQEEDEAAVVRAMELSRKEHEARAAQAAQEEQAAVVRAMELSRKEHAAQEAAAAASCSVAPIQHMLNDAWNRRSPSSCSHDDDERPSVYGTFSAEDLERAFLSRSDERPSVLDTLRGFSLSSALCWSKKRGHDETPSDIAAPCPKKRRSSDMVEAVTPSPPQQQQQCPAIMDYLSDFLNEGARTSYSDIENIVSVDAHLRSGFQEQGLNVRRTWTVRPDRGFDEKWLLRHFQSFQSSYHPSVVTFMNEFVREHFRVDDAACAAVEAKWRDAVTLTVDVVQGLRHPEFLVTFARTSYAPDDYCKELVKLWIQHLVVHVIGSFPVDHLYDTCTTPDDRYAVTSGLVREFRVLPGHCH